VGQFGSERSAGKLLRWLSGGRIQMAPMGAVYDTLHFPDGFEIMLSRPEAALKLDLKEKFPAGTQEIDNYFKAMHERTRRRWRYGLFASCQPPLARAYRWWKQKEIHYWRRKTTGEVIAELISDLSDPKLGAVLSTHWGDYGGRPKDGSFAMHARVVSHYFDGAHASRSRYHATSIPRPFEGPEAPV
jgi:all-trans-retinol 13,14-reductase